MTLKELLGGKPTPAALTAELQRIEKRLTEVEDRLGAIGDTGEVRKAARLAGDVDAIVALTHEAARLDAEDEALREQRMALKERRERAIIEAAPGEAAKALKAVPAIVAKVEAAKAELDKHQAALQATTGAFVQARAVAIRADIEAPSMDEAMYRRVCAATGALPTKSGGRAYGLPIVSEDVLPTIRDRPPGERYLHTQRMPVVAEE